MLWLRWQQHKADRAEARSVQRYLERRAAHRMLFDIIVEAQRWAEARWRLELALKAPLRNDSGVTSEARN
jgi:hypothetical protein